MLYRPDDRHRMPLDSPASWRGNVVLFPPRRPAPIDRMYRRLEVADFKSRPVMGIHYLTGVAYQARARGFADAMRAAFPRRRHRAAMVARLLAAHGVYPTLGTIRSWLSGATVPSKRHMDIFCKEFRTLREFLDFEEERAIREHTRERCISRDSPPD